MMSEVLKKFSCPMYGHHWGLNQKFEKSEQIDYFQMIL